MTMQTGPVQEPVPDRARGECAEDALFATCLPAIGPAVEAAAAQLGTWARAAGFGQTLQDNAQIVLAEALNNIVEHGYRVAPRGAMTVTASCADGRLVLSCDDWGDAMRPGVLDKTGPPAPEALAEGGYGWFLIRTLCASVEYRRSRGRNHLRLVVAPPTEPPSAV